MFINPAALPEFTQVRRSLVPGAGLGLFATRFIPRNTVWWRATADNVLRLSRRQYEVLVTSHLANSELSRQFVNVIQIFGYSTGNAEEVVIAIDDGRFVNHSDDPNSVGAPGNSNESMAARDIAPGDEITEDYRTYSMAAWGVPDQPFVLVR